MIKSPESEPKVPLAPIFTERELADCLKTSVRTLRRWRTEGRIPAQLYSKSANGRIRYTADQAAGVRALFLGQEAAS